MHSSLETWPSQAGSEAGSQADYHADVWSPVCFHVDWQRECVQYRYNSQYCRQYRYVLVHCWLAAIYSLIGQHTDLYQWTMDDIRLQIAQGPQETCNELHVCTDACCAPYCLFAPLVMYILEIQCQIQPWISSQVTLQWQQYSNGEAVRD